MAQAEGRPGRVVVVPDELTTTVFADAVTRISGVPARERVKARRSLGEIMVLARSPQPASSPQPAASASGLWCRAARPTSGGGWPAVRLSWP